VSPPELSSIPAFAKLLLWFWWPLWLVILVALWGRQGRAARLSQLKSWRISMPLSIIALFSLAAWLTKLEDQLLLVGLPALALLAALCLPYLRRSALALIDWFALFTFTSLAILSWAAWTALQFGWPPRLAESIKKRYAGIESAGAASFDAGMFSLAVIATLGWIGLLAWRTARVKHPLWKGMVVSAGGVALTWGLLHTINFPLLNYSRSYSSIARSIEQSVPAGECAEPRELGPLQRSLLRVISTVPLRRGTNCNYVLVQHAGAKPSKIPENASLLWTGRRPSERDEAEVFSLYKVNR
jgi:hypothetical protein